MHWEKEFDEKYERQFRKFNPVVEVSGRHKKEYLHKAPDRERAELKNGVIETTFIPGEYRLNAVEEGSVDSREVYVTEYQKSFKDSLKAFIHQALESQMSDLRKEVEKKRKYHKEFECNGAFNGKGCYESWCEDQNCRNAPKEYNQALDEVLLLMKAGEDK